MASSLSRTLYRSLLSSPRNPSQLLVPFSKNFSSAETPSDPDESNLESEGPESDPLHSFQKPSDDTKWQRIVTNPTFENGVDVGTYKVGQAPRQKKLNNGTTVTLFALGTGGIRNNRRPFENEEPRDYANRSTVQWHRVSIYPENLGNVAMKHVTPGSILYLEGNLETKVFTDPLSGLVRRIREIAVRRNGRLVSLGKGSETQKFTEAEMRGVGYY